MNAATRPARRPPRERSHAAGSASRHASIPIEPTARTVRASNPGNCKLSEASVAACPGSWSIHRTQRTRAYPSGNQTMTSVTQSSRQASAPTVREDTEFRWIQRRNVGSLRSVGRAAMRGKSTTAPAARFRNSRCRQRRRFGGVPVAMCRCLGRPVGTGPECHSCHSNNSNNDCCLRPLRSGQGLLGRIQLPFASVASEQSHDPVTRHRVWSASSERRS